MNKTFITTEGRELKLGVISPLAIQQIRVGLRKEYEKAGERLSCPTYQVTTAGGDIETQTYDAESIKTASQEDQELYAQYLANQAAFNNEENNRLIRYMLTEGLHSVEGPTAEWIAQQARFGITLPNDPIEARLNYLQLAVLKTEADQKGCMEGMMMLALDGRPAKEIEAVQALFRRTVERSES